MGAAIIGMHSIRELASVKDNEYTIKWIILKIWKNKVEIEIYIGYNLSTVRKHK